MKTSALKKKHLAVVEAPAPADPPRAALAAAITAQKKADAAVLHQQQTVEDAREQADKVEARLEKLAADISKAEAADIARAASTLKNNAGKTVPVGWQKEDAEQALATEKDRHELMRRAIEKLKADLADLVDDAARAHNEVLISVKRITLPVAQKILDETAILKRRVSVNRHVLDLLTASEHFNEQPRFSDRQSLASMKAQDRRDAVLHEIREQTESLFFGNVVDSSAVEQAIAAWREALTALRTNAETALPT